MSLMDKLRKPRDKPVTNYLSQMNIRCSLAGDLR